jgi:hypothetical protein
MPWNVWCPHWLLGKHQIPDVHKELLEPQDLTSIDQGKTSLTCPICRKQVMFPNGLTGGAVDGSSFPAVYWSRAKWDKADPAWKANALVCTPNLEQFLK